MQPSHPKTHENSLGSRLAQERLRLGMNQGELAEALGISRVVASRYECNKHVPGGEVLLRLHQLGADIVFILSGSKPADITLDKIDFDRLALSLDEARRQTGLTKELGQRELLNRALVIYQALTRFLSPELPSSK